MCVFMHHDVKVEKDTIPAEERRRQKAKVEREEGNKENRKKKLRKLLWSSAKVGKFTRQFQG